MALPEKMQKRNLQAILFDSGAGAARQTQHPTQELLLGNVLVSHGGATATVGQHHLCMPMTQRQIHE